MRGLIRVVPAGGSRLAKVGEELGPGVVHVAYAPSVCSVKGQ